ncbi:hypothetical protein LSH36_101g01054 [Paralvinella palmiformis]|uniref:C2H2-type domain-containing protein n=1 Tax=Paralvinella palmiformis TaxID=53620 RepID=A0AAD9K0E5_9ANNE|nr:hypothetical protein LSH36_101g01054 [Paralvinella palmiformis]
MIAILHYRSHSNSRELQSTYEDIHQCGRCKEIFHSIDEYFRHKKEKSCQKLKDDSHPVPLVARIPSGTSPSDQAKQAAASSFSLDYGLRTDVAGQVAKNDDCLKTQRSRPGANRRGRPRKLQHEKQNRKVDVGARYTRRRERQPTENRGTPIKLRDRGKIFPKKKWADSFEETSSENCDAGDDVTSGETIADSEQSRRRRGRPPKSTTYSHIMKPARPYPRENIFFCPECDHFTNHRDEYDRHLRVFHRLSTYICPVCHLPFGDKYKLRRHQEKKVCSREADPNVPTPKFMQFKSTNRIYRHTVLDSGAKDKGNVDAVRINTKMAGSGRCAPKSADDIGVDDDAGNTIGCAEINEFSCLECDEFFSCYAAIMDHLKKQHPSILPGICQFCGKWFSSKYRLWRHMTSSVHDHVGAEQLAEVKKELAKLNVKWKASNKQKHERCRKYNCVKCKKTFNARSLYLHHMKKVHNPSEICQKNICDWCGVIMTCSQTAFEHHLDTAHHVKARDSYCTCTVCNKVFNQRSHVTRHKEALHTPLRQVSGEHTSQNDGTNQAESRSANDRRDLAKSLVFKTQEDMDSELDERGTTHLGKVFTCFVCCQHFEYKHAYRDHLELHRVWVPDPDNDGPFPKDLFSSATYRSLTLTSEPSADVIQSENNESQSGCTGD